MIKESQQENTAEPKKISSWDDAIADAKQRIKDMQFSLKVFQESKKRGEPWPGNGKAGTAA